MLLAKAVFNPRMAVPINVTVTMPMIMPKVVKTERILLARIALQEIPNPSFNSPRRFMREQSRGSKVEGR